jgi:hypothetical protein
MGLVVGWILQSSFRFIPRHTGRVLKGTLFIDETQVIRYKSVFHAAGYCGGFWGSGGGWPVCGGG